jgi:hypothetical protein
MAAEIAGKRADEKSPQRRTREKTAEKPRAAPRANRVSPAPNRHSLWVASGPMRIFGPFLEGLRVFPELLTAPSGRRYTSGMVRRGIQRQGREFISYFKENL